MKIGKFWVVTRPRSESVMDDILFQTDVQGLARQFRGGLKEEEIHGLYIESEEASNEARRVLAAYQKYEAEIRGDQMHGKR